MQKGTGTGTGTDPVPSKQGNGVLAFMSFPFSVYNVNLSSNLEPHHAPSYSFPRVLRLLAQFSKFRGGLFLLRHGHRRSRIRHREDGVEVMAYGAVVHDA